VRSACGVRQGEAQVSTDEQVLVDVPEVGVAQPV
jgi:hypothetical protein